jgi:IMP dehydrogenase
MLKVRDIMSRDVFTVSRDATLDSVLWELDAELMSGAPVADDDGVVVGMVTRTDIARAEKPLPMTRVRDVMNEQVFAVGPDEPALAAARLMADKGVHRVLVAHDGERPRGIVTSMDVVRAVAHGLRLG